MSDSTFAGDAFAPDLPDDRAAGALSVAEATVDLVHNLGTVSLPRAGLVLRIDGNAQLFAHFTHPAHPNVALVTDDLAILRDPRWATDTAFQAQYTRETRRTQNHIRRFRWGVAGLVMATLVLVPLVFLLGWKLLGWALLFLW